MISIILMSDISPGPRSDEFNSIRTLEMADVMFQLSLKAAVLTGISKLNE